MADDLRVFTDVRYKQGLEPQQQLARIEAEQTSTSAWTSRHSRRALGKR